MNTLKESIQKCLTMPNHEPSMCELKKTSHYFTNKTTPLFSPNLPSRTWAGSEFCKPLPAQTISQGRSFPIPLLGVGDMAEVPAQVMADKTHPSKGLPAQGLCYWFRIAMALATQLNNWTGLDNISSQDTLVPSTPALPGLLWPTQPPQCGLGMPIFLSAKAHLTFSFF